MQNLFLAIGRRIMGHLYLKTFTLLTDAGNQPSDATNSPQIKNIEKTEPNKNQLQDATKSPQDATKSPQNKNTEKNTPNEMKTTPSNLNGKQSQQNESTAITQQNEATKLGGRPVMNVLASLFLIALVMY